MDIRSSAFGIVVSGTPAPGINGVIAAVTIEVRNRGIEVIGFLDGFEHLCKGYKDRVMYLHIEDVSNAYWQGGCILRSSRADPTLRMDDLENSLDVLHHHNIRYLLGIGGRRTAWALQRLQQLSAFPLAIGLVPKSIHNEVPLPLMSPTLGYESACSIGAKLVRNIMADSRAQQQWCIVHTVGGHAGHLALGIGKAAAATLVIIPEEFGHSSQISFTEVVDKIDATVIKRLASGRKHGTVVVAEGIIKRFALSEIVSLFGMPDADAAEGRAEVSGCIARELRRRYRERGFTDLYFDNKNLGIELRCGKPNSFDVSYTRDLGYGAVKTLLDYNFSNHVVVFDCGRVSSMPFAALADSSGRLKIRYVDVDSESYQVAQRYMIRMGPQDKNDSEFFFKMVECSKLSFFEFEERFGLLLKDNPQIARGNSPLPEKVATQKLSAACRSPSLSAIKAPELNLQPTSPLDSNSANAPSTWQYASDNDDRDSISLNTEVPNVVPYWSGSHTPTASTPTTDADFIGHGAVQGMYVGPLAAMGSSAGGRSVAGFFSPRRTSIDSPELYPRQVTSPMMLPAIVVDKNVEFHQSVIESDAFNEDNFIFDLDPHTKTHVNLDTTTTSKGETKSAYDHLDHDDVDDHGFGYGGFGERQTASTKVAAPIEISHAGMSPLLAPAMSPENEIQDVQVFGFGVNVSDDNDEYSVRYFRRPSPPVPEAATSPRKLEPLPQFASHLELEERSRSLSASPKAHRRSLSFPHGLDLPIVDQSSPEPLNSSNDSEESREAENVVVISSFFGYSSN